MTHFVFVITTGHVSANCRQNPARTPRAPGAGRKANGSAIKCYNCGGLNHTAASCLAPAKPSTKTCYNCGGGKCLHILHITLVTNIGETNATPSLDHLIRDCDQPKPERVERSERPARTCYNCGAIGVSLFFFLQV